MQKQCAVCSTDFEAKRANARYCGDRCRQRGHRGAGKTEQTPEPADGIQSTEAATMLALAEAQKLGTPGGQAVLVLARRIDASQQDTGAGLASMVKRLQETLETLVADAPRESDPVDEVSRRREAKLRAAAG